MDSAQAVLKKAYIFSVAGPLVLLDNKYDFEHVVTYV
jgi:hypothetical protein